MQQRQTTPNWCVMHTARKLIMEFLVHCISNCKITKKCIGGVMVSMLVSIAVDHGFEPRSGQTKDYKIGICCFSAKHATLRRKRKDWLARNQDNVSEWHVCFNPLHVALANYRLYNTSLSQNLSVARIWKVTKNVSHDYNLDVRHWPTNISCIIF